MNDQQLSKLERALAFLREANKDYATTGDVAKVFRAVIDFFRKRDADFDKKFEDQTAATEKTASSVDQLRRDFTTKTAALDKSVARVEKEASDELASSFSLLETRIDDLENEPDDNSYVSYVDTALSRLASDLKRLISAPETPESIRNKLESLIGPSRLKIEAIFDLQEQLDELRKLIEAKPSSGGATTVIAYTRGAVKAYDLSDQLDGSTKTFKLPAFWRVISVLSTSTPGAAFRPGIDYNTDADDMSITFTDQIDAGSTLAAGQSLLITYAEP